MGTIYIDTETTGLSPAQGDRLVEVAVVDDEGRTLLDTLIDPERSIPTGATGVHGITNEMVRGMPTLATIVPMLERIVGGHGHAVMYNASFDAPFFPESLWRDVKVDCAMLLFADLYPRGNGRWQKLGVAAAHCGHIWSGVQHRALADALAARTVWRWCCEEGAKKGGAQTA